MITKQIFYIISTVMVFLLYCGPKPAPDQIQSYKQKADKYISENRYDKAIKELRKSLAIDSKDSDNHFKIAGCYHKLGETDSAITYYEGAIVFNPLNSEAYEQIGHIYFEKGEFHEAMTWYDRAQQISYLSAFSYARLGMIYQNWRELQQAKTYFEYAVAVDSTNADGLYGLATINLIEGDTALAVIMLTDAFDLKKHSEAAYKLGIVQARLKKYNDALQWFEKCEEFCNDEDLKKQAYQRRMEIIMLMKAGQE